MTDLLLEKRLFNVIAGERREPRSGVWLERIRPSGGEPMAAVPDSDLLDLVAAVQAANKAEVEWAKSSPQQRSNVLLGAADAVSMRIDELARCEAQETGTPIKHARHSVARAADSLRLSARLVLENEFIPNASSGSATLSNRFPVGLVGVITPFAEALSSAAQRLGPALACGNAVILKPSSSSSCSVLHLAEIFADAGLPAGAFNVVCGTRNGVGEALLSHPGVQTIAFAGSHEAGRAVYLAAADGFKRLQMSLGGRNAVVVFADTDLEKTATEVASLCFPFHAPASFRGSRLFVQETVYKPFLEALRAASSKLVIGEPEDDATDIGPMPSDRHRQRFARACEQASAEKGKVLFASGDFTLPSRPSFVSPYGSVDLTLCSTLQQEEVVGPFVSIASFKYQHDAVKYANNSPLGQAAYIFTPNLSRAGKTASKIEAGEVFVNSARPVLEICDARGGVKGSGFGSGDGLKVLLEFFSRRSRVTLAF